MMGDCKGEQVRGARALWARGALYLLPFVLVNGALYAWIVITYPLLEGLKVARNSWVTLADHGVATALFHAGIYALLMLSYGWALRLTLQRAEQGGTREGTRRVPVLIFGGWLCASLILLFAYPGESLDVFDYLFRGRMQVEYGASPLALPPTPYLDRPFAEYITWRGQVDTYGPLWEYASGAVAYLVGAGLRAAGYPDPAFVPNCAVPGSPCPIAWYITGYRLLALLLTGLCGGLIYRIVQRQVPALAPAALLAWLWNPLLLITTALGAHNDVLMILCVLAALRLWQCERRVEGWLALALAAHVKLTALLLLPPMGLWLLRRYGWRRALGSSLAALALALPLSWLLYAPYGGWATLPPMLRERTRFLANAPADLLYRALQEQFGWAEPAARQLATNGATALFCAVAAFVLLHSLTEKRRTQDERLISPASCVLRTEAAQATDKRRPGGARHEALWRTALTLVILYLLIGSFWFQHWYLLWALALAALLPASRWSRRLLPCFCLGALWSNLVNDYLSSAWQPSLTTTQVAWASVLTLLLPLALAVALPDRA